LLDVGKRAASAHICETISAVGSLQYGAEKRGRTMRYDSWVAASRDGTIVRYAYKELSDGIAGISAEKGGTFLMILQRSIRAPLSRKQVEWGFRAMVITDSGRS
jgi:hypothetical protein